MSNKYLRHGILPIETVIDAIQLNKEDPKAKMPVHTGHQVGINSLRLKTFARAKDHLFCVTCGIEGKFFSIDSFYNQPAIAHLNLFAVDSDGKEVLLTCDHIRARALGGADNLSNTQVMCSPCNNRKGGVEGHQVNVQRHIQKIKPENRRRILAIIAAQSNPVPIDKVERELNRWAELIDAEKFEKRVDDRLYKLGWKRKAVKQLIDDGKIKFDRYTLRG